MKNKYDESICSILSDSQLIASPKQICNHLNKFSTIVAVKINRYVDSEKDSTIFLSLINKPKRPNHQNI